jgi:hypothetical protein
MKEIIIALLIGIAAGAVDVIPMLFMKLDRYACLSALTHWIFLGLIIPFVGWSVEPWLKGLIIGELAAVPVIIMTWPHDKKSFIPILLFSAVLGIAVGISGSYFIG